MSERRSEGSRRSRRPRCHRTPGYLWARLVSPVGVRCLAFLLLHLAAPSPAVQRYPAPLAFQWRHLQDRVLLSLPAGAETKDSVGRPRRVSPWGRNALRSAATFGVVTSLFAVMAAILSMWLPIPMCSVLLILLTKLFGHPVQTESEFLDLDHQIIRERGEPCCSGRDE